jgi:hypothetical protein
MAYDCKHCIPWNYGPELCATQVEDHSFFFIKENIDPRMSREREKTVVISILAGQATTKDIEREFRNIIGSESWRWTTRSIIENRYLMRFPNPKMIKEWGYFDSLPMKSVNAQMKVNAYNSSLGAKGELQQAWFRI